METFQAALDGLLKESKEHIAQAQEAAATAILTAHVVPHRVAVAIAQRFTLERVGTSYPVLCLIDAILARTSAAAARVPTPADQALAAVLKEFWRMAEGVFVPIHDFGAEQPAWREKCVRLVKRWKQRKLLKDEIVDNLLRLIERGAAVPANPEEGERVVENVDDASGVREINGVADQPGALAHELSTSPPASTTAAQHGGVGSHLPPPPSAIAFTAAQAQSFTATLQACMSALESLTPSRKTLYLDLIHAQHFRTPTKASLVFYEELLGELRREVTASSADTQQQEGSNSSSVTESSLKQTTGGVNSRRGTNTKSNNKEHHNVEAASASHAREALGKLLDQLHTGSLDEPHHSHNGGHRSGVSGVGGSAAANTTVVRYVSPIFSDVYAKQPLGQRGHSFGILQRKAEHGSSNNHNGNNNAFYTSYYPKSVANAQRPFRIPATRQMQGGAVRLWFPSPQDWVRTIDMADLAQYAGRNVADKDRKRTREEA